MMKETSAYLQYEIEVKCPHCEKCFDLIDTHNDVSVITDAIFNNKWDGLKGFIAVCDYCDEEFKIKSVE